MNLAVPALRTVEADCATQGLVVLAAFHPNAGDALAAGTIVLIGNAGPSMWRAFSQSGEFALPDHPLDQWSRRVIGAIAARHGAAALFPFAGPPYHPFQSWAMRAGTFSASPLGVLVHPVYGPWFAFRGAIALTNRIELPPADSADPCGDCRDKPCLTACPVGAISLDAPYDVAACREHVSIRNNSCFDAGCLARHACPLGRDFIYAPDQARFHMDAFSD